MLTSLSIKEFAARMATQEPPPGGGSTAALSGLMAAGLQEMVVNLSEGQPELAVHAGFLAIKKNDLSRLHTLLEELVDRDAQAFRKVMEAFKMPKDSPVEIVIRDKAIQESMYLAAEVPIETARACLEVLEISRQLLDKTNPHALGDLTVGALAAHTGAVGALLSTAMNLPFLKDEAVVKAFEGQVLLLRTSADELIQIVKDNVYSNSTYAVMKG